MATAGGTAVGELDPAKVATKSQKDSVLYVGMDLGCYKTSVAATNGTRETVYSIVGWPKDPVSRKMLGKDIVFGNEAFQHRLALETVRPFEKGALKYIGDEEAGIKENRLARYKEAAKAYEDALKIDPGNASAKSGLALANKRM